MSFILGLLFGYCIRGKKPLLIATLSAIAVGCFRTVSSPWDFIVPNPCEFFHFVTKQGSRRQEKRGPR